jgi:hypothetical protein
MLAMPRETVTIIAAFLDVFDGNDEHSPTDGDWMPRAWLLFATCKEFSWLRGWDFVVASDQTGVTEIRSVDLWGRERGPQYWFVNGGAGAAPLLEGFAFYKDRDTLAGDYIYTICGLYSPFPRCINGELRFTPGECRGISYNNLAETCLCAECAQLARASAVLQRVDPSAFEIAGMRQWPRFLMLARATPSPDSYQQVTFTVWGA